ncbi:TPA: hypothetical protein ACK3JR_001614 [Mannheimia haemolytica]
MPSVIRFEQAVADKNYELACTELLSILSKLDGNFGGLSNIELDVPQQLEYLENDKTIPVWEYQRYY